MSEQKRTEYLRGIASSAPEVNVLKAHTTHEILKIAFDAVSDRNDWKNPINALLPTSRGDSISLGLYLDAIEYFTGTKAEVFLAKADDGEGNATFRIVSEGYRLGPAGA